MPGSSTAAALCKSVLTRRLIGQKSPEQPPAPGCGCTVVEAALRFCAIVDASAFSQCGIGRGPRRSSAFPGAPYQLRHGHRGYSGKAAQEPDAGAGVSHQQRIVRIGNRIVLRLYQKTGRCGRVTRFVPTSAVGRLARLRPHQQTVAVWLQGGRSADHRIDQRGAVGGGGLRSSASSGG